MITTWLELSKKILATIRPEDLAELLQKKIIDLKGQDIPGNP